MAPPSEPLDAFWLPGALRDLLSDASWEVRTVLGGRAVPPGEGIAVRWPILDAAGWASLLQRLRGSRGPAVPDVVARWQRALEAVPDILMEQPQMLEAVSRYTGYPSSMLMLAFAQGELMQLDVLGRAIEEGPTWAAARSWQRVPGDLPGALRFFPASRLDRWAASWRGKSSLFRPAPSARFAVGFGAGNVPGNGLLIALQLHIANQTSLGTGPEAPPAVLVRNSRQAPLLAPWVLSAVEEIDPDLVSGLAMLVWDYYDDQLQWTLLGQADLVLAAAGDQAIASIDEDLQACGSEARFLRHGHKVSFSIIGRGALGSDLGLPARLAALDSTFWDQYGCLSARVHFVERGGAHSPAQYAAALSEAMGELARHMPRGVAPARFLHRAYDTYKLLESQGAVSVLTDYEDDYLVVLDDRNWNVDQWRDTVNRCTGRVVVVRPIDDLGDVARGYLARLPTGNLQSVSLAVAAERVLPLSEKLGSCGVTAVRGLGRAAFPKVAYSWDGLLPLDLGNLRPEGHFTTLETVEPLEELASTASRLIF